MSDLLAVIARTGGPKSPPPAAGTQFTRPGHYIATHRIRPLVAEWLLRFEREHDSTAVRQTSRNGRSTGDGISNRVASAGSRDTLAMRAGVSVRLIHRILSGDQGKNGSRYLTIDTVDRLFVGMDCVGLFYREPTNELQSDGFADVYFHAEILGDPVEDEPTLADVLDKAVELASLVHAAEAEVAIEDALATERAA